MIGGVTIDQQRPNDDSRPCGPPAKSAPAACTAPIAWPPTACWKASSMAPRRRRPPRARRSENDGDYRVYPLENPVVAPPAEPLDLADIRNSLKSLMWRNCGVRRSGERLAEALETVDGWRRYVLARQFDDLERLGAAKHAHARPRHDRGRPAPRGIARRPPAHRPSHSSTTPTGTSTCGSSAASRIRWSAGDRPKAEHQRREETSCASPSATRPFKTGRSTRLSASPPTWATPAWRSRRSRST